MMAGHRKPLAVIAHAATRVIATTWAVVLSASLSAQTIISASISPVCATAQSERARTKDMPWDISLTQKGGIDAITYDHYLTLSKSAECSCATAESVFPAGSIRSLVVRPELKPLYDLARLNLELPACQVPPDMVLASADCLVGEIRDKVESGIRNALANVDDETIKPLIQDSVVRGECLTVDGRSQYRLGVWRHAYGNLATLRDAPGIGKLPDEPIALHLTGSGLRQMLVELTPALSDLLGQYLLTLASGNDKSVHLHLDGEARPGQGSARTRIGVDVRLLKLQSSIYTEGLSLTDSIQIDTPAQRAGRSSVAQLLYNVPAVSFGSLRCNTQVSLDRGVGDALHIFEAVVLAHLFGPFLAGGLDELVSDKIGDALKDAKFSGAICTLIDKVPSRTLLSGAAVVTLDFTRAVADDSGVHLYGGLGLEPKQPVAWITVLPLLLSVPPPALPPARWFLANSRDLVDPSYTWLAVTGTLVSDPALAAVVCGPPPSAAAACVLPPTAGPTWVTLTAMEPSTGAGTQASYYRTDSQTTYCSSMGCTHF